MFHRKREKKKVKLDKKLIEGIMADMPVYIKDTGIKVSIQEFTYNKREDAAELVQVELTGKVTTKAIDKLAWFEVRDYTTGINSTKTIVLRAGISREHLSLYPYESKGAKVLYGKTGK